jgi:hypothetical protein
LFRDASTVENRKLRCCGYCVRTIAREIAHWIALQHEVFEASQRSELIQLLQIENCVVRQRERANLRELSKPTQAPNAVVAEKQAVHSRCESSVDGVDFAYAPPDCRKRTAVLLDRSEPARQRVA